MGDTLYYNGSNQRLPIGTTGQVLTVVAGLPAWSQATNVPIGGIIAWSPAGAGTNTIPTNFALCDGLVHNGITTPNLIGRCILGTQPTGGGATPSAGGYGTTVCDANTVGSSTTHNHGLTTAFQGFASAGGGLPVNLYACQSAIQLDASVSLVYIERVMMINLGGLL
jgi:hypothetical protein